MTAPHASASNFAHLAADFPAVHAAARDAEALARAHPTAPCILAGKAVELALRWVFDHDAALAPAEPRDAVSRLIHDPALRPLAGQAVLAKLEWINKLRNAAAHGTGVAKADAALQGLRELHHVMHWLGHRYGHAKPPHPHAFDPALLGGAATDAARDAALREADAALTARAAETEALRARVLSLDEALRAARAAVAAARAAASASDVHDYDEAATRDRFIDVLLAEAGWTGLKPGRDLEYRVAPMPNEAGEGFADYVLWGADGLPLAVIEAKRATKDPRVGQEQARLYADALEAMHGRRPVIFFTNGAEHWIWDDAAMGGRGRPPRRLGGFYTRDELEQMIQRRTDRLPLASVPLTPTIAERFYQRRAIARIAEHFDAGQQKALLVMATGTGKTRTVVSLVDVMQRARWAKRMLFLADRKALVRQAVNAFKAHLPASSPVNLVTEKDKTGRVHVSTYPTMMNLIDRTGEGEANPYGPGFYDLIVVDEAHRSIYKRFRAIFDYFDAQVVGLTATPRDEVDRDTYRMFDLDAGVPTDAYDLAEAVADKYLVPFEAISVPTKFMRAGIRYEELSDAEKEAWDEAEWGEDGAPDEIAAGELNTYLFNADTVDKVLAHVMANGLKVEGGDKLGKTIIFAAGQRHADFIVERFNAGWPALSGFAQVITHSAPYAQSLIDRFSQADKAPQIAVSVDMLDTGIDVPEIVNLLFFKLVRSKTKFWQMVGRGTRLRPDLFGPGQDKDAFRIFDVCGNLEFFSTDVETKDAAPARTLSERLFAGRLALVRALEDQADGSSGDAGAPEGGPDQVPSAAEVRDGFRRDLRAVVDGIDLSSFVVRPRRRAVERFHGDEAWTRLDDDAVEALSGLADLPTSHDLGSEEAKRFDLLMFELQLSLLSRSKRWGECCSRLREIAAALGAKMTIPAVARHAELIEEIGTEGWWEGLTVGIVEGARRRLRDVVHLIDRRARAIVYTDFEDELGASAVVPLAPASGVDFAAFRKKAHAFLDAHADHLSLVKLRTGRPLTTTDLAELERMLVGAGVASDADIATARETQAAGLTGFGVFVRSLVGLDRAAAKEAFQTFLADGASADQIEFVNEVIGSLTRNGIMDPSRLYESPFTDRAPHGPDSVVTFGGTAPDLIAAINKINRTAVAL